MNFSFAENETIDESGCIGDEDLESEDESRLLFEFISYGILLNIVGLFGIMGNVVSMIILTRPQMKSSINYLLTGLARCDTVLILTSIFLFGIPAVYRYSKTPFLFDYYYRIYPFLSKVLYPVALIAQTVTVYLTLTVTLERFVAVCHPLQARRLCTYGRARIYVILVIIFSVAYNLSRFWEVNIVEAFDPAMNMTVYSPEPTEMRKNPQYISIYINWLYLFFIYFFPFTCLAILNTAIYRQVRKANRERQKLSRLQKKEIGLATMLLCVVIVFFLCNILALVVNILESFYCIIFDQMVQMNNLLVTINSSVNFVIYVIFGEKFKRLFIKLFCTHGPFCSHGRESPDCNTFHEESVVLSNGETRFSIRATNGRASSKQIPCVYYPGRQRSEQWSNELTVTTSLNSGGKFY
ncbi:hypothetical protein GE061_019436 [Apolygus lucorum]|uniref:G-protein coupled receptors family 1 profile domain-containing protein n=1 Tax=Apolygus lucorum TaxID=248454 RepID=A0A6A4JVJ6_APOLU|nr:hypothetical protein GE061_019436 [Apolygus lucorum]